MGGCLTKSSSTWTGALVLSSSGFFSSGAGVASSALTGCGMAGGTSSGLADSFAGSASGAVVAAAWEGLGSIPDGVFADPGARRFTIFLITRFTGAEGFSPETSGTDAVLRMRSSGVAVPIAHC